MRRDLIAAREKHGVYLQNEDYNGMLTQIDSLNKDLINKIQLLKVREDELSKQEDIMKSLNMNLYETKNDLTKNLEILKVKEVIFVVISWAACLNSLEQRLACFGSTIGVQGLWFVFLGSP